jgi:Xaa-Pro aminopeptidase
MRTHGGSKVAFDLIVAAGPNGALPHAHPGDRTIQAGEAIVFDLGCVVDGYCSDLTRTVCLGEPSDKYLAVFEIVSQAQRAAEAAIRPGVTGMQADAVARDLIAAAGYGDHFGHGLGRLSTDTLQAGMSLTVEPGIYLPGEFGVRIEDLVIIRDGGVEILSGAPKQAVVGR